MKQEMRGNIFHFLCWSLIIFLRLDLYLDAAQRAQKPYDITILVFYGLVAVLLAAQAMEILIYYHWHHRAKQAAEMEERFLPTYGAWWRGALQVTISFAAIFVLAYDICGISGAPVIVVTAVLLLYNFGSNAVKNHLARRGKTAGRWADITVPMIAVLLIALICLLMQSGYLHEQHQNEFVRKLTTSSHH